MSSFEFLAVTISIVGLSASIIYYANVLRNTNKTQKMQLETRQAQLFIQICNQTLNNPAFMKGYYVIMDSEWKDFNEYIEFLGKPGSENWNDIFLVGGILESIGVMVKENLVDISLVWSLMGRIVIEYYEKIGPMLKERSRLWSKSRSEHEKSRLEWKADYLYHELMKYIDKPPELTA
jgi:hypothetical protein